MTKNPNIKDWYDHRNDLQPDMVFRDIHGDIIKLDKRVPGDGTKWFVADWNGYWAYEYGTTEPSDLVEYLPDFQGQK